MTSTKAKDHQNEKGAAENEDTAHPGGKVGVHQDVSGPPEREVVSTTDDQTGNSGDDADDEGANDEDHDDEDADGEDHNDEDQISETSYYPEEAIEDDMDEDDFNVEEHRRVFAEQARRLEEFRKRHPDAVPNQLDIQYGHLQDVIATLPDDLSDDPVRYREELLRRGVAEALINQQMEDMALFNARPSTPTAAPERPTSPSAEHASEPTGWNATLAVRFPQEEQNQQREQHVDETRNERPASDQEQTEHEGTEPVQSEAEPPLSPRCPRLFVSALTVVDEDGQTLFSLESGELLRAQVIPPSSILYVDWGALIGSAERTA